MRFGAAESVRSELAISYSVSRGTLTDTGQAPDEALFDPQLTPENHSYIVFYASKHSYIEETNADSQPNLFVDRFGWEMQIGYVRLAICVT
jgi:hypothetical protein